MVRRWCTCGGAQLGCIPPFLIWTCKLCREETCFDGDAHGALLGSSAVPVFQSAGVLLREVGGKGSGLVCGAPAAIASQHLN